MRMRFKEIFERLGLPRHAHAVYRCLLEEKYPLLVAQIGKRIGVARPEVYRCLRKLLEKELVKKTPLGKRTAYVAESPRRIDQAFRKIAREVATGIDRVAAKRDRELPGHIRYFSGFSGMRAVFDDVISHTPRGETFYRYTSERDLDTVNRYLSPSYRALRDKKRLERLVISNPVSGERKRPRLERFIKFIPPEVHVFDQNIIQIIYGDRLAFLNINKEEAFVIEDRALADFQKVIFNQLYDKL